MEESGLLTNGRVADTTVSNQYKSKHERKGTRSNAEERERVGDPSMVDWETRLGRVDLVSTGGDGTRKTVSLGGDNVVTAVEGRVSVVGSRHGCWRSCFEEVLSGGGEDDGGKVGIKEERWGENR